MTLDALNHISTVWWSYVAKASWQATVVGLLVLVAIRLGRRWPAPLRYWLLLVALAKFAMPPMLAAPMGAFSLLHRPPGPTIADATRRPVDCHGHRSSRVCRAADESGGALMAPWGLRALLLLHVAGAMAIALASVRRLCRLARVSTSGTPVRNGELHTRFVKCHGDLGMRRQVHLRVSGDQAIPTASGVFRPVVMVSPSLIQDMPSEELDSVLIHELAHHRRGDVLVGRLQLALNCVWWFNPVVWLLNREVRQVREECCDDWVLSMAWASPTAYCDALVRVIRGVKRWTGAAALGLVDQPSRLRSRMRRILDPSLPRHTRLSGTAVVAVAVAAALLLPGYDGQNRRPVAAPENVEVGSTASASPPLPREYTSVATSPNATTRGDPRRGSDSAKGVPTSND